MEYMMTIERIVKEMRTERDTAIRLRKQAMDRDGTFSTDFRVYNNLAHALDRYLGMLDTYVLERAK